MIKEGATQGPGAIRRCGRTLGKVGVRRSIHGQRRHIQNRCQWKTNSCSLPVKLVVIQVIQGIQTIETVR